VVTPVISKPALTTKSAAKDHGGIAEAAERLSKGQYARRPEGERDHHRDDHDREPVPDEQHHGGGHDSGGIADRTQSLSSSCATPGD
jgi:hypothetical protein